MSSFQFPMRVLTVHQIESKHYKLLQPAGHSFSPDGFLRYGNQIMLANKQTNSFLVCDIWDRIPGTEEIYAVTASPNEKQPVRRSVFVITPYSKQKPSNDVLCYGDQFLLSIHPKLMEPRIFYL